MTVAVVVVLVVVVSELVAAVVLVVPVPATLTGDELGLLVTATTVLKLD